MGDRHAEQTIPGPRARLELSLEQLALVGTLIGLTRRRLDAEQERCLGSGVLSQDAILAENRQIADAFAVAEIDDARHLRFLVLSFLGMAMLVVAVLVVAVCPLANSGSDHIGQLQRDRQPIGYPVGQSGHRAFERGKTMHVLVIGGRRRQNGIAQLIERDVLEGCPGVDRALGQGRSGNRNDRSGGAGAGKAGWMMGPNRR